MTPDMFERSIFDLVNEKALVLEQHLSSDVIFYHGGIFPEYFRIFRDFVEEVRDRSERTDGTVSIVLRTGGGSAETTEKMVNVLRNHYDNVYFVIPDMAMSAGTIFCMSGDKIYMDYASSLGPIDPQVPASGTGEYVPAMGYYDKVHELVQKGNLQPADVVLLKSLDLAKLALYEQARDLSIDLLTDWLVNYKFRDWTQHRTTNPGAPVTIEEKNVRAKQIASDLANHKRWRSHGRNLDVVKLKELRIEIDDYTDDLEMRSAIRDYNDPLTGFVDRQRIPFYLHHHLIQA